MTPERWGQLEEQYMAARVLPASERTALLERVDPEMHATFVSVLAQEGVLEKGAAPGDEGAFLDRPAWEGRHSLLDHAGPLRSGYVPPRQRPHMQKIPINGQGPEDIALMPPIDVADFQTKEKTHKGQSQAGIPALRALTSSGVTRRVMMGRRGMVTAGSIRIQTFESSRSRLRQTRATIGTESVRRAAAHLAVDQRLDFREVSGDVETITGSAAGSSSASRGIARTAASRRHNRVHDALERR